LRKRSSQERYSIIDEKSKPQVQKRHPGHPRRSRFGAQTPRASATRGASAPARPGCKFSELGRSVRETQLAWSQESAEKQVGEGLCQTNQGKIVCLRAISPLTFHRGTTTREPIWRSLTGIFRGWHDGAVDLGVGYEGTGKLLEAISEYQKAIEISNGDHDATASLAHAFAVIGRRAEAEKILHDFERKSKSGYVSPYRMATIYAGLGERDKAFEFLERAYQERSLDISWHLKADLRIDNLRSNPRFKIWCAASATLNDCIRKSKSSRSLCLRKSHGVAPALRLSCHRRGTYSLSSS